MGEKILSAGSLLTYDRSSVKVLSIRLSGGGRRKPSRPFGPVSFFRVATFSPSRQFAVGRPGRTSLSRELARSGHRSWLVAIGYYGGQAFPESWGVQSRRLAGAQQYCLPWA